MPVEPTAAAPWSLRRRLLVLTTLVTLLAWLVGGTTTFVITRQESSALDDLQMRSVARTMLALADHEIDEIRLAGGGLIHIDEDPSVMMRYRYQIWLATTRQLLLTNGEPADAIIAPFEQSGMVTRELNGEPARTVVEWSEDRAKLIMVAEPLRLRNAFPQAANLTLFGLFLVSLAALLTIDAWMIRRATRSLHESAAQLQQRSPDDLRPIEVDAPPSEVQPLVSGINALFKRFAQALETERRFTSSAAHELRTPLAAVKVHAQVAQLTRTAAERKDALSRLLLAIDRASHMIDQLLTLSRLDGMLALNTRSAPLRLDLIAAHVIEELRPLLKRRRQTIDARLSPCEIEGMEFGIASLLRNLIDNALRYGPADSAIRVGVGVQDGRCVAVVEDAGPGIPPEERERVFQRFHRLYSNSNSDGCGIGLSIVRSVATVHRAEIELGQSDLGGLRVCVSFPALAPVTPA